MIKKLMISYDLVALMTMIMIIMSDSNKKDDFSINDICDNDEYRNNVTIIKITTVMTITNTRHLVISKISLTMVLFLRSLFRKVWLLLLA